MMHIQFVGEMMNKNIEIIKKHPFKSFFIVSILCTSLFVLGNNIYHSTKVKDINDPRFDPNSYRFEDYLDSGESQKVLEHIFPVGTPKEKIDALLLKKLGAQSKNLSPDIKSRFGNDHNIIFYKVPYNPLFCKGPPLRVVVMWPFYVGGRSIEIDYDQQNKLVEMHSMIP